MLGGCGKRETDAQWCCGPVPPGAPAIRERALPPAPGPQPVIAPQMSRPIRNARSAGTPDDLSIGSGETAISPEPMFCVWEFLSKWAC